MSVKKLLMSFALKETRKRAAFREVFNFESKTSNAARVVLAELRKFCPTDPTHKAGDPIDERKVLINIGKRQVLSEIMRVINMSDDRIQKIAEQEMNYGRK